jgi:hypothetical protein
MSKAVGRAGAAVDMAVRKAQQQRRGSEGGGAQGSGEAPRDRGGQRRMAVVTQTFAPADPSVSKVVAPLN